MTSTAPPTDALRAELERCLGVRVRDLGRSPYAYASSHPLELVTAELADGDSLRLIFKDLSPHALLPEARAARQRSAADARREIDAYRELLVGSDAAPVAYGSVCDPSTGRFWLFLEHVGGHELYTVGDFSLWLAAARALATLHEALDRVQQPPPSVAAYDAAYIAVWAARAVSHAAPRARAHLARVSCAYHAVVERLTRQTQGLLHGDLYASNLLVEADGAAPRVVAVDWETIGIGPRLLDLATLSAGSWSDAEREQLARAYRGALSEPPWNLAELLEELEWCRLHVAVRGASRSPLWEPPAAHRHDWVAEALSSADRLGL